MTYKFIKVIILFLIILLISACGEDFNPIDDEPTSTSRGTIVSSKEGFFYSKELIQNFFAATTEISFTPQYDVQVISIVYNTINHKGEATTASGIIAIPITTSSIPFVSLHHGTVTKSTDVGSVNNQNAIEAIIAASAGYLASESDFLGYGVSTQFHPYHHYQSSADCVIDMLRATREYCNNNSILLSDKLFLAGYSEGGYVTAAVQKEIEHNYSGEFQITASAPMAGAFDLKTTARSVVSNVEYERPSFLSFIIYAYNLVYDWNKLDEIFKSPYNQEITSLFDGTKSTSEIDNALTTKIEDLFTSEFLTGARNETLDYLENAFNENSLLDWTPIAPTAIIHGNLDTYVPYSNASAAYESWTKNGNENVSLFTILGGDHATSLLPAIGIALIWFDSYLSNPAVAFKSSTGITSK